MIKWQHKAIKEINPNANYTAKFENETFTEFEWGEGTAPISLADINAKAEEIKAKEEYADFRAKEYPTIKDQLDDLYHNGIDGWKKTIKAVKDKYPKSS